MNKSYNLFLLICFCCLTFCVAIPRSIAQGTIAYVDADAVVKAMPEYRKIQADLEIFQKQLVKSLDS